MHKRFFIFAAFGLIGFGLGLALYRFFGRPAKKLPTNEMKTKDFEFGETSESEAFFDRNPKFMAMFERLILLANKCFGRWNSKTESRTSASDLVTPVVRTSRKWFFSQ
jgi:hypothetical protein